MTDPGDDEGHGHSHRFPRAVLTLLAVCIFGLLLGVVLSAVQTHRTNARLAVLEEYVEGRGERRDREMQELEALVRELDRQAACDLLDQLPASPWLDAPRGKYRCGPGLTPEETP